MQLPFVVALVITYRRPKLLASCLAQMLAQDYPKDRYQVLILDDGDTFDEQGGKNWYLWSTDQRFPNLHAKYNWLWNKVKERNCDIVMQIDDDDNYMPGYISAHAAALRDVPMGYSKPEFILSDYMYPDDTGRVGEEYSAGRFPSCQAWQNELLLKIGGFIMGHDPAADQHLIGASHAQASQTVSPWGPYPDKHQYIFRWHRGDEAPHSSSHSGEGANWYNVQSQTIKPVERVGVLTPKLDERTIRIMQWLKNGGAPQRF